MPDRASPAVDKDTEQCRRILQMIGNGYDRRVGLWLLDFDEATMDGASPALAMATVLMMAEQNRNPDSGYFRAALRNQTKRSHASWTKLMRWPA